jgi:sugar phosphate isomerase/epimerase
MLTKVSPAGTGDDSAQSHTPVYISLSAFGAAEVRRHGQCWFTALSFEAGADGIEVRSELLVDTERELQAIANAVKVANKKVVYSSADYLWNADGGLNSDALAQALAAARTLNAARIKMAMGGFNTASHKSIFNVRALLQAANIELLIENDQTPVAGTLTALQDFFNAISAQGFHPGMTFDIGNWHWTGECPLQAATALAQQVHYVHCKGVQRLPHRWVAVPLAESSAPWRAVLRALPAAVPWAIEYPLAGDDLLMVTRQEINHLRTVAASMAGRPPGN